MAVERSLPPPIKWTRPATRISSADSVLAREREKDEKAQWSYLLLASLLRAAAFAKRRDSTGLEHVLCHHQRHKAKSGLWLVCWSSGDFLSGLAIGPKQRRARSFCAHPADRGNSNKSGPLHYSLASRSLASTNNMMNRRFPHRWAGCYNFSIPLLPLEEASRRMKAEAPPLGTTSSRGGPLERRRYSPPDIVVALVRLFRRRASHVNLSRRQVGAHWLVALARIRFAKNERRLSYERIIGVCGGGGNSRDFIEKCTAFARIGRGSLCAGDGHSTSTRQTARPPPMDADLSPHNSKWANYTTAHHRASSRLGLQNAASRPFTTTAGASQRRLKRLSLITALQFAA